MTAALCSECAPVVAEIETDRARLNKIASDRRERLIVAHEEATRAKAEIERLREQLKATLDESSRTIVELRGRPHEAVYQAALAEIARLTAALASEYARGRAETVKDAAEIAEQCSGGDYETPARTVIARRIRDLVKP